MTARLSGMSADLWETLIQRVRAGAAMLDGQAASDEMAVPKNWRELIDRDELNLANPFGCVLGQIARYNQLAVDSYGEMLHVLDLGIAEAVLYGFAPDAEIRHDYGLLTLAWQRYLDGCRAG